MFSVINKGNDKYCISFKGVIDQNSYTINEKLPIIGQIYDKDLAGEILDLSISELIIQVGKLTLPLKKSIEDCHQVELTTPSYYESELTIFIELSYSFENWARPYSIFEYWGEITKCIDLLGDSSISYEYGVDDDEYINTMGFEIKIATADRSINSFVNENIIPIENIIKNAQSNLLKSKSGLEVSFNFPPEIKAPCEQYLTYFSQFMIDLGIKVSSNLNHEGDKTLLSIIPEDKNEALGNIRDALIAFLALPNEVKSFHVDISKDIAVAQLEFNITNLNSQLQLVQTTMMAYERTIQAQKLAIEALQIKDECNALNIIPTQKQSEDDIESVFGKFIQVKKYDKNGVVVNYPEIVRSLKRKFTR
ncbi:hypothetical protein [Psychromonas sp. L1A2]|uniref:hypothetical protein n=1 Tax=Psychromonas sp. L1A2 TaxID=2686356 RepID=UPI00135CB4CE|nr:hypothetical protein [Psychromonas sp. L1A2]